MRKTKAGLLPLIESCNIYVKNEDKEHYKFEVLPLSMNYGCEKDTAENLDFFEYYKSLDPALY